MTAAALYGPAEAVTLVLKCGARATDPLSHEAVEFIHFAAARPPCDVPSLRLAAGTNALEATERALGLLTAAQTRDDWNADQRTSHRLRLEENLRVLKQEG